MKTNHDYVKELNQEMPSGVQYVGETDSPGEVLVNVDKLLAEHGLEIEMLNFNKYYHSFRIIKRKG